MKNKTRFLLFVILAVFTRYNTINSIPSVKLLTIPQTQSVKSSNTLSIISSVTTVKRGETGVIIIQGIPKTQYSIKTYYKLGNKTIPVVQVRTTDTTGVATFNWVVSMKTTPGTYEASIFGKGNTINTTHVVLP